MKRIVFVAAVLVLSAQHLLAVELGTGVELPKGAPIEFAVADVASTEEELGLTKDFIRTQVELRLRRNGLTPVVRTDGCGYYVYINVMVVRSAFSYRVEFMRVVRYQVDGAWYVVMAPTYSQAGTGTHTGNREFIIDQMGPAVDALSNEIHKSFK